MSERVGAAVAKALDAATLVIAPPEGLATTAIARYRRHRRRRQAITAVIVAVAAGLVLASLVLPGAGRRAQPPAGRSPSPAQSAVTYQDMTMAFDSAYPAERVWPGAVRFLPATLPDGTRYEVLAETAPARTAPTVAAGVYVVQQSTGYDSPGSVLTYQPSSGQLRTLLNAHDMGGAVFYAQVLDDRYVVVQSWATSAGSGSSQLWLARIADGRVTGPITGLGPDIVGPCAMVGDRLLWSKSTGQGREGIFAADSPDQIIPGSAGFFLTGDGSWAARIGASPPSVTWWNIQTGERHELAPLGAIAQDTIYVSGLWALVVTNAGPGPIEVYWKEQHRATVWITGATFGGFGLGTGRFVQVSLESDPARYLWDLKAGTIAVLMREADARTLYGTGYAMVNFFSGDPNVKAVLNLAAIG
jgi:hypothetical protein